MIICYRDRVPLTKTADGQYQCPECHRTRSKQYWRSRMPDAELRAKSRMRRKKKAKAAPPVDITALGPQYRDGLLQIMERQLAATRDQELIVEHMEGLVADRRNGDQGDTRLDEFNAASLDSTSALVLDTLLLQELANLFGLEPYAKRKLLRNLIDRLVPPKQARTVAIPPR